MKTLFIIYAAVLISVSLTAFAVYGADKAMARRGGDRISERTLLALAVYGGALGAFVGRLAFRHKTNKAHFSAVIIISLLLQAGVLILLAAKGGLSA